MKSIPADLFALKGENYGYKHDAGDYAPRKSK